MRLGVLGTGRVGQAIATRLVEVGHDVVMGGRDAANPNALDWASGHAERARAGTFADAAAHGEVLVNATAGTASVAALTAAGAGNLAGKPILDVANPLDFSQGFPPVLAVAAGDSLAEQLQRAFPAAHVVKALNTMTAAVMVHPDLVPGTHHTFLAGDDPGAKDVVAGLLREFGWPAESIVDLGGVREARGLEMYVTWWMSVRLALGTAEFNVQIMRR
jgi:8-hydroxy-5-deazaflavin:NADPH oxidoreductase